VRRYTLEEVKAMSAAELRAIADVVETLSEEKQGDLFACSLQELQGWVLEQRDALAVHAVAVESGVLA
jgi:hypothetical protein